MSYVVTLKINRSASASESLYIKAPNKNKIGVEKRYLHEDSQVGRENKAHFHEELAVGAQDKHAQNSTRGGPTHYPHLHYSPPPHPHPPPVLDPPPPPPAASTL